MILERWGCLVPGRVRTVTRAGFLLRESDLALAPALFAYPLTIYAAHTRFFSPPKQKAVQGSCT